PGGLPEDQASRLAATMVPAVAADTGQVHRVGQPPQTGPGRRVTRLEGDLVDHETLPAELEHLRHERQGVQLTALVESGKDLLRRLHLDHVTDRQRPRLVRPFTPSAG